MRNMIRFMTAALLLIGAAAAAHAQLLSGPKADDYPIIAELYANPARFVGRTVMVYGLVVDRSSASIFMLQDVSQHPLKIVGNAKFHTAAGDQIIVVGTFKTADGGPYIVATSIVHAKVLGGGGCC